MLFVRRTGCPWSYVPQELGCGSGATCWRRLRDWQRAGVWARLERERLQRLSDADQIDWSRAAMDSMSVPAKRGGTETGPNPTDRAKPGSKRHVVVDAQGIPLATVLTAANVNDSVVFENVLNAMAALPRPFGARGHPRSRPRKVHADKGYDKPHCRRFLSLHGIGCRIARIGVEPRTRLGRHRGVVERTGAWFNRFRRLRVRDERRADMHAAFLSLATALILLHFL